MFGWLKLPNCWTAPALALYRETAAAARQPVFYAALGVPDTLDGRFDMLMLHAGLLVRRLNREGAAGRALAQEYFDRLFVEMDRAVREMGVGDLSVRRHVRQMMRAFYGRAVRYGEALDASDHESLKAALARNVYGGAESVAASDLALGVLARYVFLCEDALGWQEGESLLAGRAGFPPAPAGSNGIAAGGKEHHETQESHAGLTGMVLRD